jgi:hypothetical protein
MKQKLLTLLPLAGLLILMGQIPSAQASKPGLAAIPYGVDGQWSEQDLQALLHLAFPQTYADMQGRFGFPGYRDAQADYYQLEETSHIIAIDYDGATAIGWRLLLNAVDQQEVEE